MGKKTLTLTGASKPQIADAQTIDSNPKPTSIEFKQESGLLNLIAWNIESGGNDPAVIAEQMKDFAGADIVALNEVGRKNVPAYTAALGENYLAYLSETGGADHLAILFNSKRFELLEKKEMMRHGSYLLNNGTHRSPLYVRLKERESKQEFIFMTNHLARRKDSLRQQQAVGLREWARDTSTPIIAMGDFNFDYNFRKKSGNRSFGIFMQDGIWKWIPPTPLIDTNWSGQVRDSYPDSMLDFVFVANGAKKYKSKCSIVVRGGDFPDSRSTSDHRATWAEVRFAPDKRSVFAQTTTTAPAKQISGFENGVVTYTAADGVETRVNFGNLTLAERKLVMETTGWGRIWEDDKGTHHVIADLIEVNDKAVVLERADGTQVTVPFVKLSKTDRAFAVARKSLAGELPEKFSAKVISVADGDTLTVLLNRKRYKVRVAGIDAPEKGQAFGQKSKKRLSGLIFGKQVFGVRESLDKYGRNVCTLKIDSNDVANEMLREGLAWQYQKFSKDPELQKSEGYAKAKKLNIWSEAGPIAPWDWRKWGEAKRKNWLLAKEAAAVTPASTATATATVASPPTALTPRNATSSPVKDHWINTKSGARHNSGCRWFNNTKSGHMCGASEGHACHQCGG